jgi:hypothetical protein
MTRPRCCHCGSMHVVRWSRHATRGLVWACSAHAPSTWAVYAGARLRLVEGRWETIDDDREAKDRPDGSG